MGTLGNIIGNAVNAASGNNETTLEDFLSKFNSSSKYIEIIDPKTTFDTTITFYPGSTTESDTGLAAALKSLGNSFLGSLDNALDNVTGGIYSSLASTSFSTARGKFSAGGDISFIKYLLEANLLKGAGAIQSYFASSDPIELLLGPYVQEITIPHLQMQDGGRQSTMLGEFPNNGMYVKPDNNLLVMQIINTLAALHERIFYPWMKEVTLPYWSYAELPYTTATITIDFSKHADVKYVFVGCRPSLIFSMQAKQDTSNGDNLTRQVTFIFDFMFVLSPSSLNNVETWYNKLLNSAGSILNGAATALNF